jgi:gluconolactonase
MCPFFQLCPRVAILVSLADIWVLWLHTLTGSRRYAFDVQIYSGQPFLVNRRLFAMADTGVPDGIKCDVNGNVYSGCGDGLNIWSPGGVLLAKILVDGGVANFCFGKDGQVFLLNEYKLWRLQLHKGCKGALLGL